MDQTETEKKAYALGIVGRELGIDFDGEISSEQWVQIGNITDDALLDEPKTETGKQIKALIEKEKADSESEYNKGFNFHTDLNKNKINPSTVFVFQILAKYAEDIISKKPNVDADILGEVVSKFNDLGMPTGYFKSVFNVVATEVSKLNASMDGQMSHREDEIKAYSIGIKHPKYGTLAPHLATLREMDESIKKLREKFNFKEEDYRKSE